jgi:hypothetical protein
MPIKSIPAVMSLKKSEMFLGMKKGTRKKRKEKGKDNK